MSDIKEWAAVLIIDHGDNERGEFKVVGLADTADAALAIARVECTRGNPFVIGYTAQRQRV